MGNTTYMGQDPVSQSTFERGLAEYVAERASFQILGKGFRVVVCCVQWRRCGFHFPRIGQRRPWGQLSCKVA